MNLRAQAVTAASGERSIGGIAVFELDPPEIRFVAECEGWGDREILEQIRWANSCDVYSPGFKMPGVVYIPYYEVKAEEAS